MSNVAKKSLVILMVVFFSIGLAMADDQERKRDQKKDGSCQDAIEFDAGSILARDQKRDQKRDRRRDGSCQDATEDSGDSILAKNKKRDRKRDGSCQG